MPSKTLCWAYVRKPVAVAVQKALAGTGGFKIDRDPEAEGRIKTRLSYLADGEVEVLDRFLNALPSGTPAPKPATPEPADDTKGSEAEEKDG